MTDFLFAPPRNQALGFLFMTLFVLRLLNYFFIFLQLLRSVTHFGRFFGRELPKSKDFLLKLQLNVPVDTGVSQIFFHT